LNDAKNWYEANKPLDETNKPSKVTRLSTFGSGKIGVTPNWQQAFRRQDKAYKVVEAAFIWEQRVSYASHDCYEAFAETGDRRYLYSKSRLVIRTDRNSGDRTGFVMTLMPGRKYWETKDFEPFKNVTYIDKKDFCGRIAFHSLEGEFVEGNVYTEGEISGSFTFSSESFENSGFRFKCYEKRYTGDRECFTEPAYETIEECEKLGPLDPEFDVNENDEVCQDVKVQVGEITECKDLYDLVWDDNCGKTHP
jgi:hypothetical protein